MVTPQYRRQLRRVRRMFEEIAIGGRADCARDLAVHPTHITAVLNEREVSPPLLTRIERWAKARLDLEHTPRQAVEK